MVCFTDGPVPLEEQLGSDAGGGGQLVGTVSVQIHDLGRFRSVSPEQEGDGAVIRNGVVVVEVAHIPAVLGTAGDIVFVGDHHTGIAEEGEAVYGQTVHIAALRVGEKAPRVPRRHAVPACSLVVDHGGVHMPVGREVRPEAIFLAALCGNQNAIAPAGAIVLPACYVDRHRHAGHGVLQRDGQCRIALRVDGGDGGLFGGQVGDEPKASVLLAPPASRTASHSPDSGRNCPGSTAGWHRPGRSPAVMRTL